MSSSLASSPSCFNILSIFLDTIERCFRSQRFLYSLRSGNDSRKVVEILNSAKGDLRDLDYQLHPLHVK